MHIFLLLHGYERLFHGLSFIWSAKTISLEIMVEECVFLHLRKILDHVQIYEECEMIRYESSYKRPLRP